MFSFLGENIIAIKKQFRNLEVPVKILHSCPLNWRVVLSSYLKGEIYGYFFKIKMQMFVKYLKARPHPKPRKNIRI